MLRRQDFFEGILLMQEKKGYLTVPILGVSQLSRIAGCCFVMISKGVSVKLNQYIIPINEHLKTFSQEQINSQSCFKFD